MSLAARIGRQNREVIEALKEKGVEVKSHMSSLDEASVAYINQKFLHRGKEQITKVDNSRTEEKMVTAKPEAEKAEAPKKKKILFACITHRMPRDGGKNRPKRQAQDKKPGARGPQAAKAPRKYRGSALKKPAEAVKRSAGGSGSKTGGADKGAGNKEPGNSSAESGKEQTFPGAGRSRKKPEPSAKRAQRRKP